VGQGEEHGVASPHNPVASHVCISVADRHRVACALHSDPEPPDEGPPDEEPPLDPDEPPVPPLFPLESRAASGLHESDEASTAPLPLILQSLSSTGHPVRMAGRMKTVGTHARIKPSAIAASPNAESIRCRSSSTRGASPWSASTHSETADAEVYDAPAE